MEILGLIDIPLNLLLTVAVVVLLYIWGTWGFDYFKKQGIPGPSPYPFAGNIYTAGFMLDFKRWKETYGNVFGIFMGREPVFVISDMEILREVFVKSFNNFRNRRKLLLVARPFNLGVFFLEDAAWKRVRNIISPTFSGGKLRKMCTAINDCASTLTDNFSKALKETDSVDMKEYFGAYTMDVIATTAFGIKVDSQTNFRDPFVVHAKKIFQLSTFRRPFFILANAFPWFAKFLNKIQFSVFEPDVSVFFDKIIREILKQRRAEPGAKRTDFIQLLMEAEVSNNDDQDMNGHAQNGATHQTVRHLTDDEIVGQGILFFVAGYETTASTLNFASFALASNPEAQEKAYQEIKEVIGDAVPDYDNIANLKYLENVVTETLRQYPPIIALNRRATEDIKIKGITIPKGATVFIPTQGIHNDLSLFPEPEKFQPERHDGKSNDPSFLSFGYGPRICIGMRLALVEAKIALVHVLKKFKFEKGPESLIRVMERRAMLQSNESEKIHIRIHLFNLHRKQRSSLTQTTAVKVLKMKADLRYRTSQVEQGNEKDQRIWEQQPL